MEVVSVNVSRDDAALLLRVLDSELGGCACQRGHGRERCERCAALGAIRSGLFELLVGRARRKRRSEIAPVGTLSLETLLTESAIDADRVVC